MKKTDLEYRKIKMASLSAVASPNDLDPDRAIQQKIFDSLVEKGLPEEMAAIVVSNIGRMDLRDLWKKINKRYYNPEYGWSHSCGERYHQLDKPGESCPTCGEEEGWEWFDEHSDQDQE